MSQQEIYAAELSRFCDRMGIPEMVAVFDMPGNKQSATIHIAKDGHPSKGYNTIAAIIQEYMTETDKIINTKNG